ncbi:hypothetical protein JOL79_32980 [Microbispora sp. RL4-1S]|uniref:Uncharacterized protein n=1 Tax=Microbispora oryzae TaxID=2806554 RepID=A0A941ALY5_9ACTN|nr:hypothetical protein [Microbispora oryzae]MBP2708596.1 hypothetical protein [Microbispora oryzae]
MRNRVKACVIAGAVAVVCTIAVPAAQAADARLCQTSTFYTWSGPIYQAFNFKGRTRTYIGSTLRGIYSWQEVDYYMSTPIGQRDFTQTCPNY